jgi:L-iditol 2-dehydrogenase
MMVTPMLADVARIHTIGDVRVGPEPVLDPAPGEVMLRVTAVGLCGSDLHWYEEGGIGDAVLTRPLVLGHEFGATIADGPDAGQRVAADPAIDCGRCRACRTGKANLCYQGRFAGHGTTDGALRTFMTWPEHLLWPVPDSIPDDLVPLLEPLGVALHALDLAPVPPGGRAGVYGCGPLGLLLVQLLKARGVSTIVATDKLAHRATAAAGLGATHSFMVETESNGISAVRRHVREAPVDVAFEVAGSDDALSDAIAAVVPGGKVVLVGIPRGDSTRIEAAVARRKELALLNCRRMLPADLPRAIQLVASGSIDLASLVTDRFPLARASEAFGSLAARRGIKVVVQPSLEGRI